MTTQVDREARTTIPRFDRVERAAHWTTAVLFGVLMLTGAVLYAGPFSALFGRRELFRQVHTYAGLLLPAPVLLALVSRRGAQLRRDLGRLNRWSQDDARWFGRRNRARPGRLDLGKFNPGQKLNATFFGAAILVMLATGSIMRWFEPFPNDWRTGATFVHDWFALGIWLAVLGHIYFAIRDPIALRGMTRGDVTPYWARTERPAWYREVVGDAPRSTAATRR
ncbi:MAG TPA: cytochrome b/b6 domain-containing protein [Acidimicrobiia bacterium]|nr:cytochrome b/b6 domain-containing protein [Acidimicrobiia bacterium]